MKLVVGTVVAGVLVAGSPRRARSRSPTSPARKRRDARRSQAFEGLHGRRRPEDTLPRDGQLAAGGDDRDGARRATAQPVGQKAAAKGCPRTRRVGGADAERARRARSRSAAAERARAAGERPRCEDGTRWRRRAQHPGRRRGASRAAEIKRLKAEMDASGRRWPMRKKTRGRPACPRAGCAERRFGTDRITGRPGDRCVRRRAFASWRELWRSTRGPSVRGDILLVEDRDSLRQMLRLALEVAGHASSRRRTSRRPSGCSQRHGRRWSSPTSSCPSGDGFGVLRAAKACDPADAACS